MTEKLSGDLELKIYISKKARETKRRERVSSLLRRFVSAKRRGKTQKKFPSFLTTQKRKKKTQLDIIFQFSNSVFQYLALQQTKGIDF